MSDDGVDSSKGDGAGVGVSAESENDRSTTDRKNTRERASEAPKGPPGHLLGSDRRTGAGGRCGAGGVHDGGDGPGRRIRAVQPHLANDPHALRRRRGRRGSGVLDGPPPVPLPPPPARRPARGPRLPGDQRAHVHGDGAGGDEGPALDARFGGADPADMQRGVGPQRARQDRRGSQERPSAKLGAPVRRGSPASDDLLPGRFRPKRDPVSPLLVPREQHLPDEDHRDRGDAIRPRQRARGPASRRRGRNPTLGDADAPRGRREGPEH